MKGHSSHQLPTDSGSGGSGRDQRFERTESSDSIASFLSPTRQSQRNHYNELGPTETTDSISSEKSEASTRSTFSSLFNGHRPHLLHRQSTSKASTTTTPPTIAATPKSSVAISQTSRERHMGPSSSQQQQAAHQDHTIKPKKSHQAHQAQQQPEQHHHNPAHPHHHHHHHNPFGMLTKSSTSLAEVPRHDEKAPRAGFFKSLKKSQTAANSSSLSLSGISKSSQETPADGLQPMSKISEDGKGRSGPLGDNNTLAPLQNPMKGSSVELNTKLGSPEPKSNASVHGGKKKPKKNIEFEIKKETINNQYIFFKKYQSNLKESDTFDYAPFRLDSMHEFLIDSYAESMKNINARKYSPSPSVSSESTAKMLASGEKSGSVPPLSCLQSPEVLSPADSAGTGKFAVDPEKAASAISISTSRTTESLDSAGIANGISRISSAAELSISKIRASILHLWAYAAWKALMKSTSSIIPEVKAKSIKSHNFQRNSVTATAALIGAPTPARHQICYLQNQQRSLHTSLNEISGIEDTDLDWINSWQLAYDEPQSHINTVFLRDDDLTPRIILDTSKAGIPDLPQLSDDVEALNHSPFVQFAQDSNCDFLSNYSLYSTPSYKRIPLKNESQNIVFCHDLPVTLKKEEWVDTLKELKRILVPGGYLQLVIQDFQLFTKEDGTNSLDNTPVREMWKLIGSKAESNGFELRPSRKVLQWLKDAGYKEIQYALLTAPKTVVPLKMIPSNTNPQTDTDPNQSHDQNHDTRSGHGQDARRNSSVVSSSTMATNSTFSLGDRSRLSSTVSELDFEHNAAAGNKGNNNDTTLNVKDDEEFEKLEMAKNNRHRHKTSYYKDERINSYTSLLTGLSEYGYFDNFTNLNHMGTSDSGEDDTLMQYINYRFHGDESGKIFYDEGYYLYMTITARA